MSSLRRPPSRWGAVPRTLLFVGAIVLGLGLFFGVLAGALALRVAWEREADKNWKPPVEDPADAARRAAIAQGKLAATLEPATAPVVVEKREPEPIALWAQQATLGGKGVALGGKKDAVVEKWTSDQASVSWPVDPAAGEYHVDVTYAVRPDEGGDFTVAVGGQTLPGKAVPTPQVSGRKRESKSAGFITVRLGTIALPEEPTKLEVRPAALPKNALMSLLRVDLIPPGAPGANAAVAMASLVGDDDGDDLDEPITEEQEKRLTTQERLALRERRRRRADELAKLAPELEKWKQMRAEVDNHDKARREAEAEEYRKAAEARRERLKELAREAEAKAKMKREEAQREAEGKDRERVAAAREAQAKAQAKREETQREAEAKARAKREAAEREAAAKRGKPSAEATTIKAPKTVDGFLLVDAANGQTIEKLKDGQKLNLAALPRERLTIVADVDDDEDARVDSVRFSYDGNVAFWLEEEAPFSAFGGSNAGNGAHRPLTIAPGTHTLTAVTYSGPTGTGVAGKPYTIRFTAVDEPAELPAGGVVTSLVLFDADRGAPLMPLADGTEIDPAKLSTKNLTIVAETAGAVSSVRFDLWLNEAKSCYRHVEDNAPFTLAGDADGRYVPHELKPGRYKLYAFPHAEDGAKGRGGGVTTLKFEILGPGQREAREPLVLRAGDAKIDGPALRAEQADHDSMALVAWTDDDATATWTVEPKAAGKYAVELVYACDAGNAGGQFELKLGDDRVTGTAYSTEGGDRFKTFKPAELKLKEEKLTVRLKALKLREGTRPLMTLKEIRLTPVK